MKKLLAEETNQDETGILLLSHGPLSIAAMKTAQMLFGVTSTIGAIALEEEDGPAEYTAEIEKVLSVFPEDTLLIVDIYGGTPFRCVMNIAQHKDNIQCIAGLNLAMLISALNYRDIYSGNELIEKVISESKEAIVDVGSMIHEIKAEMNAE